MGREEDIFGTTGDEAKPKPETKFPPPSKKKDKKGHKDKRLFLTAGDLAVIADTLIASTGISGDNVFHYTRESRHKLAEKIVKKLDGIVVE